MSYLNAADGVERRVHGVGHHRLHVLKKKNREKMSILLCGNYMMLFGRRLSFNKVFFFFFGLPFHFSFVANYIPSLGLSPSVSQFATKSCQPRRSGAEEKKEKKWEGEGGRRKTFYPLFLLFVKSRVSTPSPSGPEKLFAFLSLSFPLSTTLNAS